MGYNTKRQQKFLVVLAPWVGKYATTRAPTYSSHLIPHSIQLMFSLILGMGSAWGQVQKLKRPQPLTTMRRQKQLPRLLHPPSFPPSSRVGRYVVKSLQGWAKEWSLGLEIFCLVQLRHSQQTVCDATYRKRKTANLGTTLQPSPVFFFTIWKNDYH